MADYSTLKAAIADYVKDRTGLDTIDGDGLQETLLAMVNSLGANYQFAGVATLTPTQTDPGTPDQNVFYIAAEPGTYTNFVGAGGPLVVEDGEVAIFKYNGQWSKETTGAATVAQVDRMFLQVGNNINSLDIDTLPNGVVSFTTAGVPTGAPNINYGGGCLLVTIRANNDSLSNYDKQYIITGTNICHRVYWQGAWAGWDIIRLIKFEQKGLTNSVSIDDLPNGIISFTSAQIPQGLPNINYGGGCFLVTARKSEEAFSNFDMQYVITDECICARAYWQGAWQQTWRITYFGKHIITCGAGKDYTRLRDAIAKGVELGCEVLVYPGVYDLTQEFATELQNHSGSGILLTNDVHVVFMPGAYVTCLVDVSDEWAYASFEPFRVDSGNFTLENANIKCKNTRYCVHDELGGATAQYIHKYVNCTMDYVNENQNATYVQCIGGGLGQNGYIEIIGGHYKSFTYYTQPAYPSPDDFQQPITYHNGNNADADSHIIIRDVYLADKGYLRFGNYGPSTKLTPVQVCGCRMYKPILLMNETGDPTQVQNFEIISFNNEIINP